MTLFSLPVKVVLITTLAPHFLALEHTLIRKRYQTIAAVATSLLQVSQPSFKAYARQVIANAKTLASVLMEKGYKLQTGGTDNHLVLWDLRPLGLTGSKVEKVCDLLGITINSTTRPFCTMIQDPNFSLQQKTLSLAMHLPRPLAVSVSAHQRSRLVT